MGSHWRQSHGRHKTIVGAWGTTGTGEILKGDVQRAINDVYRYCEIDVMVCEYALVETSERERLYVRNADNSVAGYDIEKLLTIMDNYCARMRKKEELGNYAPLMLLEQHFEEGLCEATQSIRQSCYFGHWDLREDEYEVFKNRLIVPLPISEDEYRKTVQTINKMWTDIKLMIETVEKILNALGNLEIEDVAGVFDLEETSQAFGRLLETLRILESRGASSVRLNVV